MGNVDLRARISLWWNSVPCACCRRRVDLRRERAWSVGDTFTRLCATCARDCVLNDRRWDHLGLLGLRGTG